MFKKVFAILLTAILIASLLAVHISAGALNPAGGCTTETMVKKAAPGTVVHDGIISPGEYTEVEINRDSDNTDMLLTWDGPGNMLVSACDFLQNVHFYTSWDENGINLAAQATLLEDPHCEGVFPDVYTEYNGMTFPGDEFFMFQFGCVFKIEVPSEGIDGAVLYRGIGINTETGEQLYGWYWDHGRTGSLNQTAGVDYYTRVDGRTVTYEMTLPFESVLETGQIQNSLPVDGAEFYFTISLTGGSKGVNHNDNETYAVSLGDGGYMTSARLITDFNGARGVITTEPVVETETQPGPDETTAPGETEGPTGTTDPGDPTGPADTTTPADPSNPADPTKPADPTVPADPANPGNDNRQAAPRTGDPMIVLAAVSVVGACGAYVVKRRKF